MKQQQIPQGYKLTELGVIPEDWKIKILGDVGSPIIGLTYSPKDISDLGILVLRSSNIKDNTLVFTDNVFVKTNLPDRVIVRKDDILICVRNGSRQLIGKCALITKKAEGMAFGAFMSVFRSKYNKFIFYLFQSDQIQRQINESMGATINQITNKDLISFKISFPTEKEQIIIANALSDIDTLINQLKKLIAKKQAIKIATMQQLLTGKTRLPAFAYREDGSLKGTKQTELGEIPEDWEICRLGMLGKVHRGVSYQGNRDLYSHDNNYTKRLLRSNNIQNFSINIDDIQYVNKSRVKELQLLKPFDTLICMANGSKDLVGKVGLFNIEDSNDYTFGAFMGCFRITNNLTNPIFSFYLCQTNKYREYINNLLAGSSINNLRPSDVESMQFAFPSLCEQIAVSTILSNIDKEITTLEQRLAKTELIKQGMMQELLTGKTRLI